MAHALLRLARALAERGTQLIRQEVGIVAEPLGATRVAHDATGSVTDGDLLADPVAICGRTHVTRARSIDLAQPFEQPGVVRVVERLTGQVHTSRPPFAPYTGLPV